MDLGSGIRDPGSGKNLFRIPDPGVKKHPIPDPGSGSATLPGCLRIFLQKNVYSALRILWDRSGICDPGKLIPDPDQGGKKAPDPGSASATLAQRYL